ncbi:MAG: hypothetical protein Q9210_006497 [Variospora velana]
MAGPRTITIRQPRCHTCCQCRSKTALICARVQCPACTHTFCCECVVDTIEVHHNPYIAQNGHPVIMHPTAPSKDMEIILRCERQRRREEGWPASERGDDAREEIAETESSSEESVREITPVLTRAARRILAPARLFDQLDTATEDQRKRKVRSPPVHRPPASLGYDEDGGLSLFRRASETLTLTELSILDERGRPRVKRSQAVRQAPAAKAQRLRKAPRNDLPSKRRAAG